MQQLELQQFRGKLEQMLSMSNRPFCGREEIAIENCADSFDKMGTAADREVAARQLELDSSRLGGAAAALKRIEKGTYGRCLHCDAEISVKRLTAIPWARYCLVCQEMEDQNSKNLDYTT